MTKTLFGIPIVEVGDLSEPIVILSDWSCWKAHQIVDGSGRKIAEGILTPNLNITLKDIERIQARWNRRFKGFEDAHSTTGRN